MLTRSSKIASRVVARRTARVDWSPCLTVYSPQPLKEALSSLDRKLNVAKGVVASAPPSVPEIDWDSYIEQGVEAEVVNKMKDAYNSKTFSVAASSEAASFGEFVKAFQSEMEPLIAQRENEKASLIKTKSDMDEDLLTYGTWSLHDWERKYPGTLLDGWRKNDLDILMPIEEMVAPVGNVDFKGMAAKLKTGQVVTELDHIPQDSLDYCFGNVGGYDWSTYRPTFPGSSDAADKWQAEFGPLWAKLGSA